MKGAIRLLAASLILSQVYAKEDNLLEKKRRAYDIAVEGDTYVIQRFSGLPYAVDFEIGGQGPISLVISTGYSETSVLTSDNPYCQNSSVECVDATYDPTKSSSYRQSDYLYGVDYSDGFASGFLGNETFSFQDLSTIQVTDVTIGIPYNDNINQGVLGLGLEHGEYDNLPGTYPGFVRRLSSLGHIWRNVYTIYPNYENSGTGAILYGAIDTLQYSGDLWTFPLASYNSSDPIPTYMDITASKIEYATDECSNVSASEEDDYYVLFDTATIYAQVPPGIYDAVMASLDADDNDQFSCDAVTDDQYITYYFSGVPIKGYLSEMKYQVSSGICGLHLVSFDSNFLILGDAFLNSLMVVYDLDKYELSIAQLSTSSGGSSIELITDAVPGAKSASEYVASTVSASACSTTSATSSTSASTSATSTTSSSASSGASSSSSSSSSSFSATITTTNSSVVYPTSSTSVGFSNSSASTVSPTLSTYVYTSVSGTLTITGTSVITVCPVCEEKTTASPTPVAEASSTVVAAPTGGSVEVTVVEGKTITVSCTSSTPGAMAPASTSVAPIASEDMTVIVVEGVTITVPCSEVLSAFASATVAPVLPAISANISTAPIAATSNSTIAPIEGSAISTKSVGLTTLLFAFIAALVL